MLKVLICYILFVTGWSVYVLYCTVLFCFYILFCDVLILPFGGIHSHTVGCSFDLLTFQMVNCTFEEVAENIFKLKYEKSAKQRGEGAGIYVTGGGGEVRGDIHVCQSWRGRGDSVVLCKGKPR